ncbi:MAG: hypothetical protein K0R50_1625 [Eubacterium sp.]|jgi:hypothetical protein|nr:hypothetical protein [Eubacterium sp.]
MVIKLDTSVKITLRLLMASMTKYRGSWDLFTIEDCTKYTFYAFMPRIHPIMIYSDPISLRQEYEVFFYKTKSLDRFSAEGITHYDLYSLSREEEEATLYLTLVYL